MLARVSSPLGFDYLKGRRVSIYAGKCLALVLTSYASSVADVANHFVLRITVKHLWRNPLGINNYISIEEIENLQDAMSWWDILYA